MGEFMKNIHTLGFILFTLAIVSTARAMETDMVKAAQTLVAFSQAARTAPQEAQAGPSNPPKASSYKGLPKRTYGKEPFTCPAEKCGKSFAHESHLDQHMKDHKHALHELKYLCPSCNERFVLFSVLHQHRRKKHPKKMHRPRPLTILTTIKQ